MAYGNQGNGLKILLIVLFIVLIIVGSLNVYFITQQDATEGNSDAQITALQNQVSTLQNELNEIKHSKLITIDLTKKDERPLLQTPYLKITCYLFNVGQSDAYNCKFHVVLYQGNVVAADTYIHFGTINSETGMHVSEEVYYQGESLTNYTVTPEWE